MFAVPPEGYQILIAFGVIGGGLLIGGLVFTTLQANNRWFTTKIVVASLILGVLAILFTTSVLWWSPAFLVGIGSLSLLLAIGLFIPHLSTIIRRFWNPKKAFGGGAFGDIANTVGVIGGLGGSKAFPASDGWWYIGISGGFLAYIVALSLAIRFIREKESAQLNLNATPHNPAFLAQVQKAKDFKIYALINAGIGFLTLSSLLIPTTTINAYFANVAFSAIWFTLLLSLVGFGIVVAFLLLRATTMSRTENFVILLTCIPTIFLLALYAAFRNSAPGAGFDWTGLIFGLLAVFLWILAEAISCGNLTTDWWNPNVVFGITDYLIWEKNIWQFVGGFITFAFLVGVATDLSANRDCAISDCVQEWSVFTMLFIIGAILALFGTIRGIINALKN